jgi:adenine-specific DNA-methyltransferase
LPALLLLATLRGMTTQAFDAAFEKVGQLAATFKANEARYLAQGYSEAQARKDFVDKFFIALGWDVNHDIQTNPYEQEVHVENP